MSGTAIALVLFGDAPEDAAAALGPALREAFGREVALAPRRLPLPPGSLDPRRGQVRSAALLDALAAERRPEWERLLGIADVDLFAPPLNFVFGEADPRRGVAVFSLARLRPAGALGEAALARFRRRAATEAIHELGHTYGLDHCADPGCVMWFSNTLAESDRKDTRFCEPHGRALARALAREERGGGEERREERAGGKSLPK